MTGELTVALFLGELTTTSGLLDVLEKNWGQWHVKKDSGKVIFDSQSTLEQYNGFIQDINAAREEQFAAQQRLASVIRTSASGESPD